MSEDKYDVYERRAINNIFNELLGRSLMKEGMDGKGEVSGDYKMLERVRYVKGVCRACYDDLCMVEKMRIPVGEYMGEEEEDRYRGLIEVCLLKLEEVGDMLVEVEEKMGEKEKEERI